MFYEGKGGLGVGRKSLQGKRTEHVRDSVQTEGGQRSAVLEIPGGVKRKKGEREILLHLGDHPEFTKGEEHSWKGTS